MSYSLDSETTGVDMRHGAKPFFVTICQDDGDLTYWEWDVDPLTREPQVPPADLTQIRTILSQTNNWGKCSADIRDRHKLVGQNTKFDCAALATLGITNWPWSMTEDTLIAGHLLASNRSHNLTDMAVQYLGVDIEPYEVALEKVVQECRRWCRSHQPTWAIAKEGRPDMPSAGEKTWKYDTWLPRAVAREQGLRADHPYWTVLSEYANADSSTTISLWNAMAEKLTERNLWAIYRERMKLPPIVAKMEAKGATVSRSRMQGLRCKFHDDAESARRVCTNIAAGMGYELTLPKSGNNQCLTTFLGEILRLPTLKYTATGKPCYDKQVMEEYLATLPRNSPQLRFIVNLTNKRKRDTAQGYLAAYERFMVPTNDPDTCVLHPGLNLTGSDTLRCSSNNPNGQNISKKEGTGLREVFGPAPGRVWYSLDYQNIELRIPAYESGEADLIYLFEHPNDPPYFGSTHLANFEVVYPDVWAANLAEQMVNKDHLKSKYKSTHYQDCKNGGFAIQYGCQEPKADATFKRRGAYHRLKQRFSKQDALNQYWIDFANRNGYVETMPDKTVDPTKGYPIMSSRTDWGKISPTIPLSHHVQGTACWAKCKAMVRCQQQLDEWRKAGTVDAYLILEIHDEILFDFPQEQAKGEHTGYIDRLKYLMSLSGEDIGVVLTVGCERHNEHWGKGEGA